MQQLVSVIALFICVFPSTHAQAPEVTEIVPLSGPLEGNTPIILRGKNFKSGIKVTLGKDIQCNRNYVFSLSNDTTIAVTTPTVDSSYLFKELPITVQFTGFLAVITQWTWTFTSQTIIHYYTPMVVHSAGGTTLTVVGDGFDKIADSSVEVSMVHSFYNEKNKVNEEHKYVYFTSCKNRNDSVMFCPAPGIDLPSIFLGWDEKHKMTEKEPHGMSTEMKALTEASTDFNNEETDWLFDSGMAQKKTFTLQEINEKNDAHNQRQTEHEVIDYDSNTQNINDLDVHKDKLSSAHLPDLDTVEYSTMPDDNKERREQIVTNLLLPNQTEEDNGINRLPTLRKLLQVEDDSDIIDQPESENAIVAINKESIENVFDQIEEESGHEDKRQIEENITRPKNFLTRKHKKKEQSRPKKMRSHRKKKLVDNTFGQSKKLSKHNGRKTNKKILKHNKRSRRWSLDAVHAKPKPSKNQRIQRRLKRQPRHDTTSKTKKSTPTDGWMSKLSNYNVQYELNRDKPYKWRINKDGTKEKIEPNIPNKMKSNVKPAAKRKTRLNRSTERSQLRHTSLNSEKISSDPASRRRRKRQAIQRRLSSNVQGMEELCEKHLTGVSARFCNKFKQNKKLYSEFLTRYKENHQVVGEKKMRDKALIKSTEIRVKTTSKPPPVTTVTLPTRRKLLQFVDEVTEDGDATHYVEHYVYDPRKHNGYDPRADNRYDPREDTGYDPREYCNAPREDNSYAPRENNCYDPKEDDGYDPREKNGYDPREDEGYAPREDNDNAPMDEYVDGSIEYDVNATSEHYDANEQSIEEKHRNIHIRSLVNIYTIAAHNKTYTNYELNGDTSTVPCDDIVCVFSKGSYNTSHQYNHTPPVIIQHQHKQHLWRRLKDKELARKTPEETRINETHSNFWKQRQKDPFKLEGYQREQLIEYIRNIQWNDDNTFRQGSDVSSDEADETNSHKKDLLSKNQITESNRAIHSSKRSDRFAYRRDFLSKPNDDRGSISRSKRRLQSIRNTARSSRNSQRADRHVAQSKRFKLQERMRKNKEAGIKRKLLQKKCSISNTKHQHQTKSLNNHIKPVDLISNRSTNYLDYYFAMKVHTPLHSNKTQMKRNPRKKRSTYVQILTPGESKSNKPGMKKTEHSGRNQEPLKSHRTTFAELQTRQKAANTRKKDSQMKRNAKNQPMKSLTLRQRSTLLKNKSPSYIVVQQNKKTRPRQRRNTDITNKNKLIDRKNTPLSRVRRHNRIGQDRKIHVKSTKLRKDGLSTIEKSSGPEETQPASTFWEKHRQLRTQRHVSKTLFQKRKQDQQNNPRSAFGRKSGPKSLDRSKHSLKHWKERSQTTSNNDKRSNQLVGNPWKKMQLDKKSNRKNTKNKRKTKMTENRHKQQSWIKSVNHLSKDYETVNSPMKRRLLSVPPSRPSITEEHENLLMNGQAIARSKKSISATSTQEDLKTKHLEKKVTEMKLSRSLVKQKELQRKRQLRRPAITRHKRNIGRLYSRQNLYAKIAHEKRIIPVTKTLNSLKQIKGSKTANLNVKTQEARTLDHRGKGVIESVLKNFPSRMDRILNAASLRWQNHMSKRHDNQMQNSFSLNSVHNTDYSKKKLQNIQARQKAARPKRDIKTFDLWSQQRRKMWEKKQENIRSKRYIRPINPWMGTKPMNEATNGGFPRRKKSKDLSNISEKPTQPPKTAAENPTKSTIDLQRNTEKYFNETVTDSKQKEDSKTSKKLSRRQQKKDTFNSKSSPSKQNDPTSIWNKFMDESKHSTQFSPSTKPNNSAKPVKRTKTQKKGKIDNSRMNKLSKQERKRQKKEAFDTAEGKRKSGIWKRPKTFSHQDKRKLSHPQKNEITKSGKKQTKQKHKTNSNKDPSEWKKQDTTKKHRQPFGKARTSKRTLRNKRSATDIAWRRTYNLKKLQTANVKRHKKQAKFDDITPAMNEVWRTSMTPLRKLKMLPLHIMNNQLRSIKQQNRRNHNKQQQRLNTIKHQRELKEKNRQALSRSRQKRRSIFERLDVVVEAGKLRLNGGILVSGAPCLHRSLDSVSVTIVMGIILLLLV